MQVYRDLRIITARPTEAEEAAVPHKLFGHIDGAEEYNAARWADEAKAEIAKAHQAKLLPILVGGTGLYMRTLIDGIAPVPEIDPAIREAVRSMPVRESHALLALEDPEAAHRLNDADTTRVARALEVVRSTGKTLKQWQNERVGGIGDTITLSAAILLPPRAALNDRIDRRFEAMVNTGAAEEVDALLSRTEISATASVRRAIGVPEIAAWRSGKITQAEAIAAGQLSSRQYAKRQMTWFRNQPPIAWNRHMTLYDDSISDKLVTIFQKDS